MPVIAQKGWYEGDLDDFSRFGVNDCGDLLAEGWITIDDFLGGDGLEQMREEWLAEARESAIADPNSDPRELFQYYNYKRTDYEPTEEDLWRSPQFEDEAVTRAAEELYGPGESEIPLSVLCFPNDQEYEIDF